MDRGAIRHVAELAELTLTEEEELRMTAEVGRILAYVAELDAIDTTDVPPTAHVSDVTAERSGEGWREDAPRPGLAHEDALAGAARTDEGGFAVPGFVE